MADVQGEAPTGLRERKKWRTRATLIDVALRLCLERGFEQTTVELIAAEADVSTRTFSRYFATKEAAFLTLIDEFVDRVAEELADVPPEFGPLEALRIAHVRTLEKVASGPEGALSNDRVALMLRVFNASDALRQAAFDYRHIGATMVLAGRMGVGFGDHRLRLVGAVFSSVIVTACRDLVADTDEVQLGATVVIERLNEAFERLAAMTADLPQPVVALGVEAVRG